MAGLSKPRRPLRTEEELERNCTECGTGFRLKLRSTAMCCSVACLNARKRKQNDRRMADPAHRAKRLKQKSEANCRYSKRHRAKVVGYYRMRRTTDPVFKMSCWSRGVLHKVLGRANKRKDAACVALLRYDGTKLKEHIERQFTKGMCWSNYGEWHIDHIRPIADFLRCGDDDPSLVHALSNLRPMWAADNFRKSDKITVLV